MRVALATTVELDQADHDEAPLRAAFAARGHAAESVAWDDPAVDWAGFDAVLLRSTWNYYRRRDAFLDWAARVAAVAALWNPLDVVRWNTHKFYLRDLHERGVDVTPGEYLHAGTPADIGAILDAHGWERAVIKPALAADSYGLAAADRASLAEGQAHLARLLAECDTLVQAYLPAVEEPGERCLVFVEGEYSHAVRKRSFFQGGRHAGPEGLPVAAADDEIAAGRRAVEAAGFGALLYARADLVRGPHGRPCVVELELVEPSLFFDAGPGSAARLAAALETRLRG